MILGSQGQGHGGNDLGWVGARHLYLNFDDPRLLVLISGYPRFLTHLYLNFDDPRLLVLISGRFFTSFSI